MGVLENLIIIALTAIVLCIAVYVFITMSGKQELDEKRLNYDSIKYDVMTMINNYVGVSAIGLGLDKRDAQNQEEQRRNVATCVRTCCSGNDGAREVVKDLIRNYLTRDIDITEDNICRVIPFNHTKDLSARILALCMILHYDNGTDTGFKYLLDECSLCTPKHDENGDTYLDITEEDIRETYSLCDFKMTFRERLDVLVQLIYEDVFGLGVIDVYNQQKASIEEIQIGLTGIQQKVYDYKQGLVGMQERKQVCYSKDAVHAVIHGEVVRLSYLSFGTEDEKQRVIRNLIKGSGAGELTIKNPSLIVHAVDGRRIAVGRPPRTDAWVAFIRKFDSVVVKSLNEMYSGIEGVEVVTECIKHLVRAGFSMGFTGEMSSGKTTLFRSALRETAPRFCLRLFESESFELDPRYYLPGRNALSMLISEQTPPEDALSFGRKTTGNCFGVGEITSLRMAVLAMALSKISKQMLLSAHYTTTEEMIADFMNANLSIGGYTSEKLAEMDAVRSLAYDVHIRSFEGVRRIQYINEIVPEFDFNKRFLEREITDDNATIRLAEAVREVRAQIGTMKTYSVRKILEYDEEKECYRFLNMPSEYRLKQAREFLSKERYEKMMEFFNIHFPTDGVLVKQTESEG